MRNNREFLRLVSSRDLKANTVAGVHQRIPFVREHDGASAETALSAGHDTVGCGQSPEPPPSGRGSHLSIVPDRDSGLTGIGQPAESFVDCPDGLRVSRPGAQEVQDRHGRLQPGGARNFSGAQTAGRKAPVNILHGSREGALGFHGSHAYAQSFERSTAQKHGRARGTQSGHAALMKMSTAGIMEAVADRTGWSWRRIAREFKVSRNSPGNWARGGRLNGANLDKVTAYLRISADAAPGNAELPPDFLSHLPRKNGVSETPTPPPAPTPTPPRTKDQIRKLLTEALAALDKDEEQPSAAPQVETEIDEQPSRPQKVG
jgi:hypothetical protein